MSLVTDENSLQWYETQLTCVFQQHSIFLKQMVTTNFVISTDLKKIKKLAIQESYQNKRLEANSANKYAGNLNSHSTADVTSGE